MPLRVLRLSMPGRRARLIVSMASVLLVASLVVACGDQEDSADASAEEAPSSTVAEPTEVDEPEAEATPTPTVAAEPTSSAEAAEQEPEASPTVAAEPRSFAEPGPFAVGVVTLDLPDRQVEVWYPVGPDEVAGDATEIFDSLSAFPQDFQAIVPPELSGDYDTGAVRDATALAGDHPVVIYGHGFGGYRQIATHFTAHLASWGFVVASADHLERGIAEQTLDLIGAGTFDETNTRADASTRDVADTLELLADANQDGPLEATMNLDQVAIAGHSAGAFAALQAVTAEPEAFDAWISIAGGTRDGVVPTQPGLVLIGELDAVVVPERSYDLFESAPAGSLLVNIASAGHNSFTDPCRGIVDLGGLASLTALLGAEQVARAQDGCTAESTSPEVAQAMQNHTTTAFLRGVFGLDDADAVDAAVDPAVVAEIGPLADYQRVGD